MTGVTEPTAQSLHFERDQCRGKKKKNLKLKVAVVVGRWVRKIAVRLLRWQGGHGGGGVVRSAQFYSVTVLQGELTDWRLRYLLLYLSNQSISFPLQEPDFGNVVSSIAKGQTSLDVVHLKPMTQNLYFTFFKWANPGFFLFIFILFKHKFYRKNVGFSLIRTRIVRVEGELADHLTNTTAQENLYFTI